MPLETERKFLVNGAFKHLASEAIRVTQGYLCSVPERTVRVRVQGEWGYLTVKGSSNPSGATRYEWEQEISLDEALELLKICEPGQIDKIRYLVEAGNHVFEIDEFLGDNQGLVIAEIELGDENEHFERPVWLGEEVTGIPKYYNAMLVKNPYSRWS
jgi:adenylate cyclase